ncbi:MAG: right-handed parallel beta-helix repeat-containing protein [Acidimicrobiales bacterium]|nr:right-handed parallel beta-helix repeat-containing protein [Acidimicrobiales bacterium]
MTVRRWVTSMVATAVVLVLGASVVTFTTPGSAAPVGPGGSYTTTNRFTIGPTDADGVDPSHTAWTNRPESEPLRITTHTIPVSVSDVGSEHHLLGLVNYSVSGGGIAGGVIEKQPLGGLDVRVRCETPDQFGSCLSLYGYTITLSATWNARPSFCYPNPNQEGCDVYQVSNTITRTVVKGYAPTVTTTTTPIGQAPVARFEATRSATVSRQFEFTNTSTDPDTPTVDLTYEWDFGDGTTSTETSPTHRYDETGTYVVRLTARDPGGLTNTTTEALEVRAALVVNSTADRAAEDPDGAGCDTGEVVGDEAECTLRAAIEAANAEGGGDISFAIDTGGIPTIGLGSPLPAIASTTTVDGTTQPGPGRVAVIGTGDAAFTLASGTSTLRGLAIRGASRSIRITGGQDHQIEQVAVGTDATATEGDDATDYGVEIAGASGVTVSEVVAGGTTGVAVAPTATGTEVRDSFVGVRDDGSTPLGSPAFGVLSAGPATVVDHTTVRASTSAVALVTATAAGSSVTDSHLGVTASGSAAFTGTGYAVRVDGVADVAVSGNRVATTDEAAAIVASGRVEASQEVDGPLILASPLSGSSDGPVTGARIAIAGNTIGLTAAGAPVEGQADRGIYVWSGAADVKVTANTVGGTRRAAVTVDDTAGAIVAGNRLGETVSGDPVPVGDGIWVSTSTAVAVGGADPNVIRATATGIGVSQSPGVGVAGNTVAGGSRGIDVDSPGAAVALNTVEGSSSFAMRVVGDGASATSNVVTGLNDGLVVGGDDVAVESNRVGVPAGSDEPVGSAGSGIIVTTGSATLTRNVVAGHARHGIQVEPETTAELRANRVWGSGSEPISAPGGPTPPNLVAAARTGSGDDERTTLVLMDLPDDDAGRLEVFANDSCDPEADGGEALRVLDINRTKGKDQTARIIQLQRTSRDHFTVTYTTADGSSSALSACADATRYGDADGDGSIDPFDDILLAKDDPTAGIIATDKEQLLLAKVLPASSEYGITGGQLEQLAPVSDPAPGSHPEGWSLPYGAIRFRISGIDPGARAGIVITDLDRTTPIQGDTYWKYGPPTPGAAAQWYPFTADETTGLGALVQPLDVLPLGYRRSFILILEDGARGDDDGALNGTITDPGGPVVADPIAPVDPTETTTTATPTTNAATSTTTVASIGNQTGTDTTSDGTLARTGADLVGFALAGALTLVLGALALRTARHRTAAR